MLCTFMAKHQAASPSSRRPLNYLNALRGLIFFVAEESALMKILTTNAMPCPRNSIEALFRQSFAAMNTLSVTRCLNPLERFIDQVEQLPIVVRHRYQQLLGVSVGSHVCRILRR